MSDRLAGPTGMGYFEGGAPIFAGGEVSSRELRARIAPHLGHQKHLCDMASKGADLQTVKDLVKNPQFLCKTCGRAAAKAENLCDPVPL